MRNKRLDILRFVAVALVLGRHGSMEGVWKEIGWAGVDLFFVLSGFLISGLLFSEYKKRKRVGLGRFFIRRGFKIYPAFYFMLLGMSLVIHRYGVHPPAISWFREIFFIQNYFPGLWRHTWSLAVEEHFYIFLPLFLIVLTKVFRKDSDPFRFVLYAFCILAPLAAIARAYVAYQPTFAADDFHKVLFPTHLRMDALFFGVVIGYLHHFRPHFIPNLLRSRAGRLAIEGLTAALLSCLFVFRAESPFMLSFGLTLVYLGFGGLLVISLYAETPESLSAGMWGKMGDALAYVGMYSYSIYLWHVGVAGYGMRAIRTAWGAPLGSALSTALYVGISIALGILMARIVEFPAMRLRDRLFPGVTGAVLANSAPSPEVIKTARSAVALT
jgi:peptidoglycan/LPS O-acetylase OafA/YrhL